jgi:hypothetical protein
MSFRYKLHEEAHLAIPRHSWSFFYGAHIIVDLILLRVHCTQHEYVAAGDLIKHPRSLSNKNKNNYGKFPVVSG